MLQMNHPIISENLLLAALPQAEYLHMQFKCDTVELLVNEVINSAEDKIQYIYFPTNAIISLMKQIDFNKSIEVGMIGNEGMLNSTLLLGAESTPFTSVVQKSGGALRISARSFILELEQSVILQRLFKRYIKVLFNQLVQNAACTRFHVVEARLARLLLMIRDRSQSPRFHVTQESLAQMLGVRRVGVTKAAGVLQHKKFIYYNRGDIVILSNAGLSSASCSCYQTDNDTYNRILHHEDDSSSE